MATKTAKKPAEQDDPNRIQDEYDEKFNDMTSPENYSRDGEEPEPKSSEESDDSNKSLYERESQPDKNSVDKDAVDGREKEQMGGGQDGELYQPEADGDKKKVTTQIAGAFAGKRKYGWIGGGIFVTILSILAIIAPTLGPLHIFNNFFNHNFEMNDSFRRQRTSRVVKSIFRANANTNRQLADTPFKLKADLIEFEKFESRMQGRGWGFEYNADNKPVGLRDPSGAFIDLNNTSSAEFNRAIDPLLKDTIPAWRMNKRVRTRNLITTFTGPRRSFNWSKLFGRDKTAEPDFEVARFKKEAGIDEIDIDGEITAREMDAESGDSPVDRALQETVDAKLNGATDTEAIHAGVAEARRASTPDGGKTSLIIGTLVVGCIAYTVNSNELAVKYEKYAAALRYGATFMLAVNEMQQGGDIDVGEVGQLFGEYNNQNPTSITTNDLVEGGDGLTEADDGSTIDVEYDKNTGSFAESAAWQRATGVAVTGPELNEEFHVIPTNSDPLALVDGIMGALSGLGGFLSSFPGFGLLCSALQSTVGFIVGLAFDVIEGIAAVAACLTGAGCIALGKFVLVEGLWEVGGRLIGAAMTSFAGFLTENPVQAAAILDQSLNLISSEETRTATPVDNATYNSAVAQFKRSENAKGSLWNRYFALDHPGSLTFALAETKSTFTPPAPSEMLASLFSLPGHTLANAATSGNVFAQTNVEFDNYGFQKYKFDPAYLEVDAYDHAEEVLALIEEDEGIVTNAGDVAGSSSLVRDFAVLCMGYDPVTGSVNKSATTSMLSMFSDPSAVRQSEAERRNDLYQALCVEAAMSDMETYARVGRFVDDLELVQSIEELSRLVN